MLVRNVVLLFQYKIIIDPANRDIVHHLQINECDPSAVFDDSNLPEGVCDDIAEEITLCATNLASTWAVGGDDVSFENQNYFKDSSTLFRSLNFPKLLDIQLEVILRSNITWFKCIMIIQN
jgi:hypothetical protein